MGVKSIQKNIIFYNNGELCNVANVLKMIKDGKHVISDATFTNVVSDPKNMSDITRRTYDYLINKSAITRTIYAIVKDGGQLGESIEFSHNGQTLKLRVDPWCQGYSGLAVHLDSGNFDYKILEGGNKIEISKILDTDIIVMERIPIERAAYDNSQEYHDDPHSILDPGGKVFDYYRTKYEQARDKYLESLIEISPLFECLKDWTLLRHAEEGTFTLWKTSEGGKIVANHRKELNRVVGLGAIGNPEIMKEYGMPNIFPPFAKREVLIESEAA